MRSRCKETRLETRYRQTAETLLVFGIMLVWSLPAAAQAPRPSFPVSFQQTIRYAIENYPAIRASVARVSAQESGVDLARTSYLPRLDTTLQINRATRNNVAGLLLPGASVPAISGPVSDTSRIFHPAPCTSC
jgi:outer membrane protein TolC